MSGGEIHVNGSVKNFTGSEMTNGKILIKVKFIGFLLALLYLEIKQECQVVS